MVFSSVIFIFYFLPLFFLFFLSFHFNKTVLLVFSVIFYAWGEPIFVPLILTMIAVNYRVGLLIERGHENGRDGAGRI
jgi:alginate O-acetyltransferase complex protein AlgI